MIIEFALIRNMNPENQTFIVYGLGKSGQAAYNLLLKRNINKDFIFQYDDKIASSNFETLLQKPAGVLVLSPGISIKSDGVQKLLSRGWKLTSEINLACEYLTTEKIIGITGSVGKSTVTSLLGAAASAIDPNVFVGGNLGIPFSQYALDLLAEKPKAQWVILELSSYQLENSERLKLDFSGITYLSANHLERYDSLDHYYQAKFQITKQTEKVCFVNGDSADVIKYLQQSSCPVEKTSAFDSKLQDSLKKATLLGSHNRENVALVLSMIAYLQWPQASINNTLRFSGLSHRLESVGVFKNILFINDSKATAMESVVVATSAAEEKLKDSGKLFLLLGGRDKNLPWHELGKLKSSKSVEFIFFGECGTKAQEKSHLSGKIYPTLSIALDHTFKELKPNDILLLSPGGTSLDEFKNFEDRGDYFKSRVREYFGV